MEDKEPVGQPGSGSKKGHRLAPKEGLSKKGKIAIAAVCAVVALLLGSYLGLCAYAAGDRVIPGTYVGDVDLSGLSVEEAAQRLEEAARERYDGMEIPIQVGDRTVTFSAKKAGVRSVGDGQSAVRAGKGSFLAGGWNYLAGLFGRETQLRDVVTLDDPDYVAKVLEEVAAAVDQPVEDPHWELNEETGELTFYRGRTGQSVDRQEVYTALLEALSGEGDGVTAQVELTAPKEPDFAEMKTQIDREPTNATLDTATDEIVPHKLGLTLDVDQARSLFSGLQEGESASLTLETREPEITTLDLRSSLFRDILGEGSSKISGDANRVGNVKLAAAACDGVILLPGEQMSYNKTTGQRTVAKGYRKASGYTANGIEDMVGGGVCQPSSTLYLACLNANLEIVERSNHRYTVSYMPDGMDATVSWPNLDYVFANNTPYPIKVVTTTENRVLTVRIYGTKTDDTYVKMESVRLSTTPAGVSYEPDETLERGTTKVVQGAHTGKKVQVYKNLYQGDGTLISRTLISTDTYRPSDKIIAYNPLDGAPDGSVAPTAPVVDPMTGFLVDPNTGAAIVDPVTGQPVTPEPSVDPNGGQSEPPAQGEQPSQSEQPVPGVEPPQSEPPAQSETPVLPPMPEPVAPVGIPEG